MNKLPNPPKRLHNMQKLTGCLYQDVSKYHVIPPAAAILSCGRCFEAGFSQSGKEAFGFGLVYGLIT